MLIYQYQSISINIFFCDKTYILFIYISSPLSLHYHHNKCYSIIYYDLLSSVLNIYYAFIIICTQYICVCYHVYSMYIMRLLSCILDIYYAFVIICTLYIYYAFVIICTRYILCFCYYVYSIYVLCFCYYVYSIYIMLLLSCVLNMYKVTEG